MVKKKRKIKVYECKYFKSDTDDFNRWIHCRNNDLPWNQCICENGYARKLCPCFKHGVLLGEYDEVPEIDEEEWRKKFVGEFKSVIRDLEYDIENAQEKLDNLKRKMAKYG